MSYTLLHELAIAYAPSVNSIIQLLCIYAVYRLRLPSRR